MPVITNINITTVIKFNKANLHLITERKSELGNLNAIGKDVSECLSVLAL